MKGTVQQALHQTEQQLREIDNLLQQLQQQVMNLTAERLRYEGRMQALTALLAVDAEMPVNPGAPFDGDTGWVDPPMMPEGDGE